MDPAAEASAPVTRERRQLAGTVLRWGGLVTIVAFFIAHSRAFGFLCDDAFISFVYARNLAESGQLVFNPGEYVEGYTNFLWTVLLALLYRIGFALESVSLLLGALFGAATLVVVARWSADLHEGRPSGWDLVPAALLAMSSGYACWASGGLETQLFVLLVTAGTWLAMRERWVPGGLILAFAALTRPEGVLIFALVVAHRLAWNFISDRRLRPARGELVFVGVFVAVYLPYFVWRWSYYGWPFPNTYYVKAASAPDPAFARALTEQGLYYVKTWWTQSNALYALPLFLYGLWRHRRAGSLLALVLVVYQAYVVRVGGDFMGLHRLILPVFVVYAMGVALGLRALIERVPARARLAAALLPAALVALHVRAQVSLSEASMEPRFERGVDRPGYLDRYVKDRTLIARALAPRVRPDDVVVVGGAGVYPWIMPMRAIDVFGLISEEVAHNVVPTNPKPGHMLWAPPELLLAHDPAFLFQCYAIARQPAPLNRLRWRCDPRPFLGHGYVAETIYVPGVSEGEFYTFLRRADRAPPELGESVGTGVETVPPAR